VIPSFRMSTDVPSTDTSTMREAGFDTKMNVFNGLQRDDESETWTGDFNKRMRNRKRSVDPAS